MLSELAALIATSDPRTHMMVRGDVAADAKAEPDRWRPVTCEAENRHPAELTTSTGA